MLKNVMQTLPYTAQLLPTLAAFGGCEYRERRLGQTAFVVFRKMLIINAVSYTHLTLPTNSRV